MTRQATLLLAYGFANAVLYSAMLPLWEGFDEPFHFGYVQYLANGQGFPDPRTSFLSREIGSSLSLAPASNIVQRNLPEVKTYSEYFALPADQRAAIAAQLHDIRPEWRWQSSHFLNYEGHHPPLAYVLLALPERSLAGIPLVRRVLIARITCAVAGTLILYFGAKRLLSEFGLRDPWINAAIFCAFSSQMTWATLAHVANDWLSVPLTVWSLTLMIRYWKSPLLRSAALVGGVLALGLLTKAYFIALVPVAVFLCLGRKRLKDLCLLSAIIIVAAGPWYTRNVLRYRTLTGMQESRAGIGPLAAIHAAPLFDWPSVAWANIRAALWTGNNTFLAFSGHTLTAIVAVWLIALVLWARSRHGSAEWITALHCAVFLAALAYNALVRFVSTGIVGTAPWYSQVLLVPMLGLAFLGLAKQDCLRSGRLGKVVAGALTALFGYVLIATYLVKLIPLYGGYEGRTSLAAIIGLYSHRLPFLMDNLNLVALAPGWALLSLAAIVTILAATQAVALIRSLN